MFTLTYLGWMVVWLIPGMVAGAVVKAGVFHGVEKWCYFNNPWETWAYAVQRVARTDLDMPEIDKRFIWPGLFVMLWSIPFFGLAAVLAVVTAASIWG